MNRAVFASLTILCLLSVSSIAGLIQVVKAEVGTIYIRADGSIDPPTAPISTFDNVTYTLTSNIINDSITVERNNIVVDGAGHTVQGSASAVWGESGSRGIDLSGIKNVTVENTQIENFTSDGIHLDSSSSNNMIIGNNITTSGYGIYVGLKCSYNIISGNNITSEYSSTFLGTGIFVGVSSSNNILSGNNITPYLYIGIWVFSSSSNIISGNSITNNERGIQLSFSSSNSISGNNISAYDYGILLEHTSSDNKFYHNNFVNNAQGYYGPVALEGGNAWDDGYPSGGNYWSDYVAGYPNASEIDTSGIWNTPYVIAGNNTDRYPLTVQYIISVRTWYNELAAQVSSNIQNANYESPDAKSLLSQAQNEHSLAVSLANQGKWQDAVSYLNLAFNLLAQASAKEQTYQDQKKQQMILIIAGVSAAVVIVLAAIIMVRKRKHVAPKDDVQSARPLSA
jgi:parallel beta-helix repeat protein